MFVRYKDDYDLEDKFILQAVMGLGCNDIPDSSQIDGGIVRTLRLIKFETVFCLKPVKSYEKIIKDYNKIELGNSFINLLLGHYLNFINDYFIPECVKSYTDNYLKGTDSIRTFCEDQFEKDPDAFLTRKQFRPILPSL